MKRISVNLSDEEYERLTGFLDGDRAQMAGSIVGEDAPPYSDSGIVKVLALAGADAVEAALDAEAYRTLAASDDTDDRAVARAALSMAAEMWKE